MVAEVALHILLGQGHGQEGHQGRRGNMVAGPEGAQERRTGQQHWGLEAGHMAAGAAASSADIPAAGDSRVVDLVVVVGRVPGLETAAGMVAGPEAVGGKAVGPEDLDIRSWCSDLLEIGCYKINNYSGPSGGVREERVNKEQN